MLYIIFAAAAVGVALDLLTLVLMVRRALKGGPSGVPIIPLYCYMFAIFLVAGTEGWSSASWWIPAALVFHVLCQFVLPGMLAVLISKRG